MTRCRVSAYRCPRRGGLNRNSRPLWNSEITTAQGLGGENRITHSTLRGGVVWAGKDPQKSAILGSRRGHNRAGKAPPAAQSVYSQSIEPPYFNRLISRRTPLASVIKGGSSGQACAFSTDGRRTPFEDSVLLVLMPEMTQARGDHFHQKWYAT